MFVYGPSRAAAPRLAPIADVSVDATPPPRTLEASPPVARPSDPAGARARARHAPLASQLRAMAERAGPTPPTVESAPGFARLSADEQAQLRARTHGDHPIAVATREKLDALMRSDRFRAATPDQQAALLREVLRSPPLKQVNQLDPGPAASTPPIAGPTSVKSARFKAVDGGYEHKPALRYDVTIDGRTVPVYIAQPVDPSGNQPSIEELARGLASLPPESRARVREVRMDNVPHPTAFMYAGDDGIVNVWPPKWKQTQGQLDALMLHETGHILSSQEWGGSRHPKPDWRQWEEAGRKDGSAVSEYAQQDAREDFAETYALYMMVRNTPMYEQVRAMYPHRFAMIEALLEQQ